MIFRCHLMAVQTQIDTLRTSTRPPDTGILVGPGPLGFLAAHVSPAGGHSVRPFHSSTPWFPNPTQPSSPNPGLSHLPSLPNPAHQPPLCAWLSKVNGGWVGDYILNGGLRGPLNQLYRTPQYRVVLWPNCPSRPDRHALACMHPRCRTVSRSRNTEHTRPCNVTSLEASTSPQPVKSCSLTCNFQWRGGCMWTRYWWPWGG